MVTVGTRAQAPVAPVTLLERQPELSDDALRFAVADQAVAAAPPAPRAAQPATTVWVDHAQSIVRRGMVSTLLASGLDVLGESAGLAPTPDLTRCSVLIFDADTQVPAHVAALVGNRSVGLLATVRRASGARLRELVDGGVCGVLLVEEVTPETLVSTTQAVASGRTILSHDLLRLLAAGVTDPAPDGLRRGRPPLRARAGDDLSWRERRVLQLLAEGEDTRSIALRLCYSERTVKVVVHELLTKLDCRTRAQVVGKAVRTGVI